VHKEELRYGAKYLKKKIEDDEKKLAKTRAVKK
jgi:hypothetical protein